MNLYRIKSNFVSSLIFRLVQISRLNATPLKTDVVVHRRILLVFLRRPKPVEYAILSMCLLLVSLILFPERSAPLNRLLTYLLFFGYAYLIVVECIQRNLRYFYIWLWGLMALTMLNTRQVNEALNPQSVKLLYVFQLGILLRSIHTSNVHFGRQPLIFRREESGH